MGDKIFLATSLTAPFASATDCRNIEISLLSGIVKKSEGAGLFCWFIWLVGFPFFLVGPDVVEFTHSPNQNRIVLYSQNTQNHTLRTIKYLNLL